MKEITFEDSSSMDTALQEKQLMSQVKHRNICRYVDSFVANGNRLYLIMEYADKGDLQQYLARLKAMAAAATSVPSSAARPAASSHSEPANAPNGLIEMGEHRTWRFFIQICLGVKHMHDA